MSKTYCIIEKEIEHKFTVSSENAENILKAAQCQH